MFTIGFFWIGVFVVRMLGMPAGYSLTALGIGRPVSGYFSGAWLGFLASLGVLAASLLLIAPSSSYVLQNLGYSTERNVQGPLLQGLANWVGESPAVAIPTTVAVVVFFGPAVEELVFRGALFGGLYRLGLFLSRRLGSPDHKMRKETGERISFALSALSSSTVFALLHGEAVIVPSLLFLAVVLCALYRRTGSLLPCVTAHATFNGFAVLLVILNGFGVLPPPV